MIFKNKRIQKLVSGLLIVSVLVPAIFISFKPKQAEATGWPVIDLANLGAQLKKIGIEIVKQYMISIARGVLKKMTQNTVNWINSGFHGNPLYLERPDSFFKDIAKSEVRNLVDLFGYDSLKYPFGKDFSLNIINSYQRQLADNAAYSLSNVMTEPQARAYRNDFNIGGWNGFLINTQYPQNNYLGFQMLATEELARRLQGTTQNAAQKVQTTLQQGQGFLSPKTCPTNPLYNNAKNEFLQPTWDPAEYEKTHPYDPSGFFDPAGGGDPIAYYTKWNADKEAAKQKWALDNTCPGGLVATTPGSIVAGTIMEALGSNNRQAELGTVSGSIQASIATILDAFLNHFLQKGLNALGNKIYPPQEDQTLDDFTFFGDSINTIYNVDTSTGGVPPIEVVVVPGSGTNPGGQCDDTGNQYAGTLRDAEDAVLSANPDVADLPNIELNGRQNARTFLKLVETELISQGLNSTVDVLNGHSNPSTGDIIAVWKNGDTMMERYDAIAGQANPLKKMRDSVGADFAGFIPLNCTASGGGKECGCKTVEPETPTPTECVAPKVIENNVCVDPTSTAPGSAKIDSISPMTATAGTTTITINGSNLTNQVSFYDGTGTRNTVVGTVNSAKTQTTVLVPAGQPVGNATVKIYQGNQIWSNGILIAINNTGGGGGVTATSVDATGGWGGNLAYNPAQNNWLVVSGGVNGRIMGNDGTPVTPEFTINSSASGGPKAVFAPDINKYLVVWIGWDSAVATHTSAIFGRFVNPDGSFSGDKFIIYNDVNYPSQSSLPPSSSGLRYDSKNKKFVLIWENRHPVVDSYMITISQSGVPGTFIDVGTDTGEGSWAPMLAVNEDLNEYCIAYAKGNGTTNVVKKYNVASGVLGPETTLDNDSFGVTSIVYNSVNKKYLITWPTKSVATTSGKILNSCNINDGGSVFTLNSAGRGGALAYNPKSNNYAVIVQNQNDSGNTYNILNSSGTKLSSGVAFTGGFGNFSPVISANSNDGAFAATSSKEYAVTRFAPGLGTSSGGSGTITTATPISTWSPAQTSNGWWAKLSPDGKYVTYGNWGESWVTDLTTGQNYDFKAPANLPTGARCLAGQWITTTKLTFICETGPTQNPTGVIRYEATIGEWIARLTTDRVALVTATMFAAKDGHWASYEAGNPRRIVKDNVVLTTNGPGGALSISGNTLVHACDGSDNPKICVWTGSTLSKTITPLSSVSETATQSGYILYAGGGTTMQGIDPSGSDVSKKIGTFSFEGKPVVFLVRGAPWIATSVESNTTNKSYVILRPWNGKSAIVLDTGNPDSGSAGIDAVFDGTNFVVAQHTNRGMLKVIKVPENATRSQF